MNKYTISNFNKDFPNDDTCLGWLKDYLYPGGIACKCSGTITKHHRVSNRPCYACDSCGNHVYPMAGTILEKSTTPLKLWFYAIYLISSTRCGISAKQLQRELGVTYKTAWRMFHQIRLLLDEKPSPMSGEVELDETYIGGKSQGKRGRGAGGKTPVFGIARREGKVIAVSTPAIKSSTIFPIVKEHVLPKSMIYTDEYLIYDGLRIKEAGLFS